jgi:glucosylceramidase
MRWGACAALAAAILIGLPGTATALAKTPGAGPATVQSSELTGEVAIHVSSADGLRLSLQPRMRFGAGQAAEGRLRFAVDDSVQLQRIDGFGASFLEAGLVNLNSLPDRAAQDAVLRALFDPKEGAGFSVMKTVIGATDFQAASEDWYTYDDTPGDTRLSHFSISRDLGPNGLITYIKRARQAGGEFQLQAPMDYPPDWMLYDIESNQSINPAYYSVLAMYFVKYLKLYEKNGVHIDYLSPFNEPGTYTKISFAQIRDFIRDYLGPALAARGVTTRIQFSDIGSRADAADNYPSILDDEMARRYIAALPYHGYDWAGWDRITALQSQYPDLPVWMTEICCAVDQTSGMKFESGDFWGNQIFSDMEAGASAWIYWNAILNEQGGPWLNSPIHGDPDPNSQNSVVVIDSSDHTVTYTGLYYYLAHFSKFVRPGARRIATTGAAEGVRVISFQNANGSRVSELMNSRPEPADVQLEWHGLSLRPTLPGTSITTIQWDG